MPSNPLSIYKPRDRLVQYLAYLLRLSNPPYKMLGYTKPLLLEQEEQVKKARATKYMDERTQRAFVYTANKLRVKPIKDRVVDLKNQRAVEITPTKINTKKDIYKIFGNLYFYLGVILSAIICVPTLVVYIVNFKFTVTRLIVIALLATYLIVSISRLGYFLLNKGRVYLHNESISTSKAVIVRDGAPGAGKTSSLIYDMIILADKMWKQIQYEYWLLKPQWEQIHKSGDLDKIRHVREICEAYDYYTTPHIIDGKEVYVYPCLWSNVPIFIDGKPCSKFLFKHMMQEAKLPYGTVAVIDEISLFLPQELHHTKPTEVKEMSKFPRHFGDFHFGATEQEASNMYKDFRRSACENKYMLDQKWICQPIMLNRIFDSLKRRYLKAEPTLKRVNQLKGIDRLRRNIGFRKYRFEERGNLVVNSKDGLVGATVDVKKKSFVLPSILNGDYDSRAFKNLYKAKNKTLEPSIWLEKVIPDKDLEEIFRPDIKELCKSKKEKSKNATTTKKVG